MGLSADNTVFDLDLIIHINTVFSILNSQGVGPVAGFAIEDETALWTEYFTNDSHEIPDITREDDGTYTEIKTPIELVPAVLQNLVKSLVYTKVRLLFDPPSNGNLLSAMKENAKELEIRIYTLKGGY